MKKLIASTLILALTFTLTGCTLLKSKQEQPKNTERIGQEFKVDTKEETKTEDNKNVFTSIKDAISKQIGLKCEYEDEEGVKATTYVKGNNVYLESDIENEGTTVKFKAVMKDKKYYLWSDENKQGMVFDLSKASSEGTETNGTKVQTQDEIIAKLEENKNKCRPENIAPSMFDTPSDVSFVEWNWNK